MLFVIKNINSRVRVQEPITFFDFDASHDYFFFNLYYCGYVL